MFKLLIVLIVSLITLIIVAFEPQMHKPVMIGTKAALSERASFESQNLKIAPQKVEVVSQSNTKLKNTNITREEYMKTIRARAEKQEVISVEPQQIVTTPIPAMTPKQMPRAEQKEADVEQKIEEEQSKSLIKHINEKIVWNKWRADICNTISDNSLETQAYHLKKGVMFKYSFNVDKNRHVSNINVRLVRGVSDEVTQDSIRDINRTIRSLEGKKILEFPKGTQRAVVKVDGGIEMADYDSSLSPRNFSDIESIRF